MKKRGALCRLILCLVSVLLVVSCSPVPQSQPEKAEPWEQEEKILIKQVEDDKDPLVTAKALSSLVKGYLSINNTQKAHQFYLKLVHKVDTTGKPSSREEVVGIAADTAAALHSYYYERMDYFRASSYLQDQISYMESTGGNVDKELQLLIDLYLNICRYQEALEIYDKWFNRYGQHAPEQAALIKDKILEKANPTQENT